MAGNRKAFIETVISNFSKIDKNNPATLAVETKLKSLSDTEFEGLVKAIEAEEFYLPFFKPNGDGRKSDVTKWAKLAASLGEDIYTKLVIEDEATHQKYVTNPTYGIFMLPFRRQSQYKDSKMSIAKDSKSKDSLTSQVSGASKGSSISSAQTSSMVSRGCPNNAIEFVKIRGGDVVAGRELNARLANTGTASADNIMLTASKPTSVKTFSSYLNAMMIANNATVV